MNDFNTLFPNFFNQCAEMNRVLTPIAFVLLAIGIVSSTVTGHRSPNAYLRTVGRTFAFAAVLAYLPTWSNEVGAVVDTTVKQTLKADPAGVYAQYQKALAINKGTSTSGSGSKSWWDLLDAQAIFEYIISAAMWLLGFLASVIVFYAYLVQKFTLYVGFALAPIYSPEQLQVRVGDHAFTPSLTDLSSGIAPRESTLGYVVVSGGPAGRNDLSLKNDFTFVLSRRVA